MLTTCMDELQERLNVEIELLRGQMVVLGSVHGFLHPQVQECSRELDRLLLQFYAMRKEN